MFFKRFISIQSLLICLIIFKLTILINAKSNTSSNEVSEDDLEKIALKLINTIESKLKESNNVSMTEVILMDMLMKEIQKRIDMERKKEANTVYWYLRQG